MGHLRRLSLLHHLFSQAPLLRLVGTQVADTLNDVRLLVSNTIHRSSHVHLWAKVLQLISQNLRMGLGLAELQVLPNDYV